MYGLVSQTTPAQAVQGGSVCAPFLHCLQQFCCLWDIKALPIPEWLPLPMRDHSWFLSTEACLYKNAEWCSEVIQG